MTKKTKMDYGFRADMTPFEARALLFALIQSAFSDEEQEEINRQCAETMHIINKRETAQGFSEQLR